METKELDELVDNLKNYFVTKDECDDKMLTSHEEIEDLRDVMNAMKLEQTKSNTKLNVLIGILSPIGIALISVCIKILFEV